MPRKGPVPKREVPPDPKYGSVLAAKFINYLMWDGKKSKAQKIFYEAMDIIAKKTGKDALEVFKKAFENVAPVLESLSFYSTSNRTPDHLPTENPHEPYEPLSDVSFPYKFLYQPKKHF